MDSIGDIVGVNMSAVLAGQTCAPRGMYGKKTAWGFDADKPTPAGRADVERRYDEYAQSRPCVTRQPTPEELAERDRVLAGKNRRADDGRD